MRQPKRRGDTGTGLAHRAGRVLLMAALGPCLIAAAGTTILTEHFGDWKVSCTRDRIDDHVTCINLAQGRTADDNLFAGAVSVGRLRGETRTVTVVRIALSQRLAFDGAILRVDDNPPLESESCTGNGCSFFAADAELLIGQFRAGKALLVRTSNKGGGLDIRYSLRGFTAADRAYDAHERRLNPTPPPLPPAAPPAPQPGRPAAGSI